jgi:hypothetical protein
MTHPAIPERDRWWTIDDAFGVLVLELAPDG